MIEPARADSRTRLAEIVEEWSEGYGPAPDLVLRIGGRDYSERLLACEWGSQRGDAAVTLSAVLWGALPKELENADCELDLVVENIVVPQVRGKAAKPRPDTDDEATTELVVASAAALADKITLDERVAYSAYTPDQVLADAFRRNTAQDSRKIRVDVATAPLLTFAGEDGFEDEDHPADITSKVAEQTTFVYHDHPDGTAIAMRDPGNGADLSVSREVREEHILAASAPEYPEDQYTAVVVRRYNDSGSYAVYGRSEIDLSAYAIAPVGPRTLYKQLDDTDAGANARAAQIAYDTARSYRHGNIKRDRRITFDPRLTKTDVLTETEEGEAESLDEGLGLYRTDWLYLVEGYTHTMSEGGELSTKLQMRATPQSVVRLPGPSAVMARASMRILPPLAGIGSDGRPYVSDELPWVWLDAETNEVVIDADIAASYGVRAYYDEQSYEVVIER